MWFNWGNLSNKKFKRIVDTQVTKKSDNSVIRIIYNEPSFKKLKNGLSKLFGFMSNILND